MDLILFLSENTRSVSVKRGESVWAELPNGLLGSCFFSFSNKEGLVRQRAGATPTVGLHGYKEDSLSLRYQL